MTEVDGRGLFAVGERRASEARASRRRVKVSRRSRMRRASWSSYNVQFTNCVVRRVGNVTVLGSR